jgi:hypothetical protein
MDLKNELVLFDQLSGNPRFKDWLQDKLTTEVSALVQQVDIDQLRRSQGRAQLLKSMLDLLDKAPTAVRR